MALERPMANFARRGKLSRAATFPPEPVKAVYVTALKAAGLIEIT